MATVSGVGIAELVDVEVNCAGVGEPGGNADVDHVEFIGLLPLSLRGLAGCGFEADGLDAGAAGRTEQDVCFMTGDKRCRWVKLPVPAGGVLKLEGGAGEGIESPLAFDGSGDHAGQGRNLGCGWVWAGLRGRRLPGDDAFVGYRHHRKSFAVGGRRDDQAAVVGVGGEGNVVIGRDIQMEDEIVRERGREDQRCAIHLQHHGGLGEAGDVLWIGRPQRWRDRGFDRRKADDDDRLGVVERGSSVEAEVELLGRGKSDGGDVLVLGGVEAAGEADEVDDGADISAVDTCTEGLGVAGLIDKVGAWAVGKRIDDGLAVAIVEQGLVAGLGEAVVLEVDGELEAGVVGFEVESAGQQVGVPQHGLGVSGRHLGDGVDVFSMRACSKPASARSCEARTKMPGRPRTADLRVEKSPPVSGARNMTACWASCGTRT